MSAAHHRDRPRHLAGARHFEGTTRRPHPPIDFDDIPIDFDDLDDDFEVIAEEADAAPVARVKQNRLAFAVAVTLAALPLLVLDNFAAGADSEDPVSVSAAESHDDAEPFTPVTAAAPVRAVTSEVPVTTIERSSVTTAAPPTTVAPTTTTAAPATTTTNAPDPTTTTAAPPAEVRAATGADPDDPATWEQLAECETGGDWSINTGNGYYGGLQFALPTWQDMGGTGYPHEASKAEQISRGKLLYERSGWSAWPGCARSLGWL